MINSPGMSRPDLSVTVLVDGPCVTVTAHGEIDMATADELHERVTAAMVGGPAEVQVDLAGVTFLDACGIRALLQLRQAAARDGARLSVVGCRPFVRDVLEIVAVYDLLANGEPDRPGPGRPVGSY